MTLPVLLDLSTAFITIDYHVLLNRLETSFAITGRVLAWFHSYLSNRSKRDAFGDGISDSFQLTCGVPKGSCLGPLLFTLNASKLFQVIKEHSSTAQAYTDDTPFYLSFYLSLKPEGNVNEKECLGVM